MGHADGDGARVGERIRRRPTQSSAPGAAHLNFNVYDLRRKAFHLFIVKIVVIRVIGASPLKPAFCLDSGGF